MRKLRVGLTYDLRSDYLALGYTEENVAEFDMDATIGELEGAIQSLGYVTERIGHARALCARLVANERWDLIFNVAEGISGRSREAHVPCILEVYGIPYTFSDPLTCAATLDKAVAKRLVQCAGLHTPAFHVVSEHEDIATMPLAYPVFAKPVAEGTGKGIDNSSRIESPGQLAQICGDLLRRFAQPVLVEEFLPGREFTVGVLGTHRAARVLGTIEVAIRRHADTDIYSYVVKEKCEDLVNYLRPERGALIAAVEALALGAYRALELRDAGRIDVRLDRHGAPAFMEANPLPGLHPRHSDLPMIATQEGMSYPELIGTIVTSALERRKA